MNLVGGSSGITRKNASTVVSAVGTNDSAPMNTTSGDTRMYGSIRRRNGALTPSQSPSLPFVPAVVAPADQLRCSAPPGSGPGPGAGATAGSGPSPRP